VLKIITYNVNGLRAAIRKGFWNWLEDTAPDILCLQEVKAFEDQVDLSPARALGYEWRWHAASRPGYSGVAIFSRSEIKGSDTGLGLEKLEGEGRFISAEIAGLKVCSVYVPSGNTKIRLAYKLDFLAGLTDCIQHQAKVGSPLILAGDFNIAATSLDLHNPTLNRSKPGCLPAERDYLEMIRKSGFHDAFRCLHQEPHHYTWWSHMKQSRRKNLGWRIDYLFVSEDIAGQLVKVEHLTDAYHSDHCPVMSVLDI